MTVHLNVVRKTSYVAHASCCTTPLLSAGPEAHCQIAILKTLVVLWAKAYRMRPRQTIHDCYDRVEESHACVG